MRNHIRRATLVATLALLSTAPSALAVQNTGGASMSGSATKSQVAAPAVAAAADPIVVRPVPLTRSQTKSVQRRVKVRADGALGSKTRKAIKRYQKVQSLTLTGRPNVETLRAMKLKIADKLEAKLRAEASGVPTEPVALATPEGFAGEALTAARTAIGTPYRNAGTTLAGFDCSGLTVWAFAKAGYKLPRTSFDQYKLGADVPKDQIQAGDLVYFDSAGSGASHVGIAASPTSVISATTRGVMEHDIAAGYWARHYIGAKRLAPDSAVRARAASLR